MLSANGTNVHVDGIGNHNHGAYLRSLVGAQKRAIFQYQSWLALAWVMGKFVSGACRIAGQQGEAVRYGPLGDAGKARRIHRLFA